MILSNFPTAAYFKLFFFKENYINIQINHNVVLIDKKTRQGGKKMRKTKNIGKILVIGIPIILFLSGMGGVVSACHERSPLYAGKDFENPIGYVDVRIASNDRLIIEYITEGGWTLGETNLLVTTSLDKYVTKSGNPKVGHFSKTSGSPVLETDTLVRYIIDLNEIFENGIGGLLYIAAHAVVQHPIEGEETAWADTGFSFAETFGGNSWALYFTIYIP